ncbi:MAG TPA: phosphoribosyltransferase family protein [Patescibacteria group bacterium]|nr:phosphoribosyltransferase family protein [Patescibacteria group bacterium]
MERRGNQPLNPENLTAESQLCLQLFVIGAIKFGDFRLKVHDKHPEAPPSPVYIDLRLLRREPEAKVAAVDVYQELLKPLKFDLLADVPTAATPLVSSLSDRLGVGMITPRTDIKTHGAGVKIDGMRTFDKGKTVVLVDDLITHADSKLEAVRILRDEGLRVRDVVVLVDRKQGGEEQLAAEGIKLHAALTMDKMLAFYNGMGMITNPEYVRINQGLADLNDFLAGL